MAKLSASQRRMQLIADVLWPPEDPDQQWDSDTVTYVAESLPDRRPKEGGAPSDIAVLQIYDVVYPPGDPDAEWSADTTQYVGEAAERYLMEHGGDIDRALP